MKANAANVGDAKVVNDDSHAVTLLKNLTHKSVDFEGVLKPPNAPPIPATSWAYLQLRGDGEPSGASENQ
jgi:hypothetical protein